jgi:hypothetical protein
MKSTTTHRARLTPKLTSSPAADRKTLTIDLSAEQLTRLKRIAGMLGISPEQLAVAELFSGLDGWSSWPEFAESIEEDIEHYVELCAATCHKTGTRLEEMGPSWLRRLAVAA